jgi:predicted secreted protein
LATIQTRNASIYWSATRVPETRTATIDLGSDFVEDTVHGDTVRTFAPLFSNFNASIGGLYSTGVVGTAGSTAHIISCALNATSATWSVYIGGTQNYFTGSGYVSVDSVTAPYDEFSEFSWSIRSIGAVTHYAGA